MWFSAFILLCVILWDFFFFFLMIVLLKTWIYYSIFSKIDLIWWDNFSYNFKYIFINEIGFIKKIVLVVGKLTKVEFYEVRWGFVGPQGTEMGWESFCHHARQLGMGQDKTMQGGDEDPILQPYLVPLPSRPQKGENNWFLV